MKSEPEVFSIDDLKKKGRSLWDGVRNYQARNFMTQDMSVDDQVLFYHSSADPSGVAGLARICSKAIPDPGQFDKKSEYFDKKASNINPIWFCVEIEFVEKFSSFVTLEQIRKTSDLKDMLVIKKGQRLSIQPVSPQDFKTVVKLGERKK